MKYSEFIQTLEEAGKTNNHEHALAIQQAIRMIKINKEELFEEEEALQTLITKVTVVFTPKNVHETDYKYKKQFPLVILSKVLGDRQYDCLEIAKLLGISEKKVYRYRFYFNKWCDRFPVLKENYPLFSSFTDNLLQWKRNIF